MMHKDGKDMLTKLLIGFCLLYIKSVQQCVPRNRRTLTYLVLIRLLLNM